MNLAGKTLFFRLTDLQNEVKVFARGKGLGEETGSLGSTCTHCYI